MHSALDRLRQIIRRVAENALMAVVYLAMFVVLAASLRSCLVVSTIEYGQESAANLKIMEIDETDPRHQKLALSLRGIALVAPRAIPTPRLLIVDSPEINAASFGEGRFLFWNGVADLPERVVDGIAAHEVAHDILRHSKKVQEMKDLTDFFADVLGFFGGSDKQTDETLRDWMSKAVIPKYTRTQEVDADAKAIELLALRGYANPRAVMCETLQLLLEKAGNTGGGFFDSHPSTEDRIEMLKKPTQSSLTGSKRH